MQAPRTQSLVCASAVSDGSCTSSSSCRISYPDDVRTVDQQRFFLPNLFEADPPDETRATTRRRRRRTHRASHHRQQGGDSALFTDVPTVATTHAAPMPAPMPAPAPAPAVAPLAVVPLLALLPSAVPSSAPARATAEQLEAAAAALAAAAAASTAAADMQFRSASAPPMSGRRRGAGGGRLVRLVSWLRRGGERSPSSTTLEHGTAAVTLGDKRGEESFRLRPLGADETSTNCTGDTSTNGDAYEVSSNSEISHSGPLQHQRRRAQP